MALSKLTRMWMESATARVMMIVGAAEDGGVSSMPTQPASPMAVIKERRITSTVPMVAVIERNRRKATMTMMRYIAGTIVSMSFKLIS